MGYKFVQKLISQVADLIFAKLHCLPAILYRKKIDFCESLRFAKFTFTLYRNNKSFNHYIHALCSHSHSISIHVTIRPHALIMNVNFGGDPLMRFMIHILFWHLQYSYAFFMST